MDASAQRKIPSSTNSPSLKCSSSCQPGRDISGMKPEGKVKLVGKLSAETPEWFRIRTLLDDLLQASLDDLGISLDPKKSPKFMLVRGHADRGQYTSNAAFIVVARLQKASRGKASESSGTVKESKGAKLAPKREQISSMANRIKEKMMMRMSKVEGLSSRARIVVGGVGYLNAFVPELAEMAPFKTVDKETNSNRNLIAEGKRNAALSLVRTVEKAHFSTTIFNLYAKYQVIIHRDPVERITHQEFKAFLVDTPLLPTPSPPAWGNIWPYGCGSLFRMYHLLEEGSPNSHGSLSEGSSGPLKQSKGKLVGFAVLDILPSCFYSSYFVWHPDARKLSLGVLSALEEMEIVDSLAAAEKNPKHLYYIGYYVHHNQQMRYKRQYQPAELYCPHSKAWVPFNEEVTAALTENPHGPLPFESKKLQRQAFPESKETLDKKIDDQAVELDSVTLLWNHAIVPYKEIREQLDLSHPALRSELEVYAQMVGPELAQRMMYVVT
eukprot:CAMPEP_0184478614 /NCGR_PEP_ID=MMETSP0113_2-20130426/590_1 /TAXON_ID=91329 /ORGANISM="Norrisiella sphaerica, Strain BC52" /LENGTH=495 /DNA_ID=CAMNT_0026856469 /DNA_START=585 /DNA_END=2072 /DNA_ORIENTATION=-